MRKTRAKARLRNLLITTRNRDRNSRKDQSRSRDSEVLFLLVRKGRRSVRRRLRCSSMKMFRQGHPHSCKHPQRFPRFHEMPASSNPKVSMLQYRPRKSQPPTGVNETGSVRQVMMSPEQRARNGRRKRKKLPSRPRLVVGVTLL